MRAAIGSDHALGVRICGEELIEGGIELDDAVALARLLEAHGGVDYLNTSIGVVTSTLYMIEASVHVAKSYALFIPSTLRTAVSLPVGGRRRSVHGSAPGRVGRSRRVTATSSGWSVVRSPISASPRRPAPETTSGPACPVNQECVGRMGASAGWAARKTGASAARRSRCYRRPYPDCGSSSSAGPAGL